MYAKLYARITESSLMEEAINVRYTFVLMLAIADPEGYVIGTDVALARRLNMPLAEFKECIAVLMDPDPNSNSKELDGRRLTVSNGERGYHLVNFASYRSLKDPKERRDYMREYMRKRRQGGAQETEPHGVRHPVNNLLTDVRHVEAEAKAEDINNRTGAKRPNGSKNSARGTDMDLSQIDWGEVASMAEAAAKLVPLRGDTAANRNNDRRQWLKYAVLASFTFPAAWLMDAADAASRSAKPTKSKRAILVAMLRDNSGMDADDFNGMVRRVNIPKPIWNSGVLGGPAGARK